MTERLADISKKIDGIRQLGAVVNAMKGIAAARTGIAHTQLAAVDTYAMTMATAMASAARTAKQACKVRQEVNPGKLGLLVFCAEQGFAGAFSERVLDSLGKNSNQETLFLIGTRGLYIAETQGVTPVWSAAMPSHTLSIPKLADKITQEIYHQVNEGRISHLEVLFTSWEFSRPAVVRQALFPINVSDLPPSAEGERPLIQLAQNELIDALGMDYFHALVCKAALHAFAAENQARMEAMASAGTQIERELKTYEATLRRVRQEAITAEIIELGSGSGTGTPA